MFLDRKESSLGLIGVAFGTSVLMLGAVMMGGCYQGTSHDGDAGADTDGSSTSDSSPVTSAGSGDPDSGDTSGDTSDPGDPPEPAQAPSSTARVKFKGPHRFATDLSDGLELDAGELCQELSTYDCFDTHSIALGGVEPYDLAVYKPLDDLGVSAPIAADRIALGACGERAVRDFSSPGVAVVFSEVAGDAAQADVDARGAVAQRLYRRLLRRDAEEREIEALVAFYDEVPASDPNRTQTWSQLSCFAVATMLENLFY